MKELLAKLVGNNNLVIGLKSGEKMDGVAIESVMGNMLVISYAGQISVIEIPHIAYVTTGVSIATVQNILGNAENAQGGNGQEGNTQQQNTQQQNRQQGSSDQGKGHGKKKGH